ncbi:hypothetical protein F3Y22_tig00110328pilonHSYRG00111 [Hibiscus syriacus]|uniref:Pentatricopeptide repeat-containing protein n=1 Tax=Hibiscus syriacus TaxID=106335 RepID=A0A6A3B2S2_HIBSY|nr:hypothetical protein F3Y22_tig00110328pilonHSYRG00111 [Hibiscus syriacus]
MPPPQSYQPPKTSLETLVKRLMQSQEKFQNSTESHLQEIDKQISQLAQTVGHLESHGKLPSQTKRTHRRIIHGNTKLAEMAAELIFEMEPENSGMYVLSNLYAASGRWADVSKMRMKMRDTGVKKVPGYIWLEVQNKIHTFSVGDSFHPDRDKIYAYLEELYLK